MASRAPAAALLTRKVTNQPGAFAGHNLCCTVVEPHAPMTTFVHGSLRRWGRKERGRRSRGARRIRNDHRQGGCQATRRTCGDGQQHNQVQSLHQTGDLRVAHAAGGVTGFSTGFPNVRFPPIAAVRPRDVGGDRSPATAVMVLSPCDTCKNPALGYHQGVLEITHIYGENYTREGRYGGLGLHLREHPFGRRFLSLR